MKSMIYYFSGTGNSLVIAKDLASELPGSEVVRMAAVDGTGPIYSGSEALGIVYPVYALGIPLMVARFISNLVPREGQYVFIVANYAKFQGAGISRARRLLRKRGIDLFAGFGLRMPNSYLPFGGADPEEVRVRLFEQEKKMVKEISLNVKAKKRSAPETGCFWGRCLFSEPVAFLSALMMHGEDKNFKLNENCDGCALCQKLCPVGNIVMTGSRPSWQHNCELCFACLNWCPREAIEFGRSTAGKERYRHPEISYREMLGEE